MEHSINRLDNPVNTLFSLILLPSSSQAGISIFTFITYAGMLWEQDRVSK